MKPIGANQLSRIFLISRDSQSQILNKSMSTALFMLRSPLSSISLPIYQSQPRSQNIKLNLSNEPCFVIGDPQQLKQVFLNLIINSLYATEGGGDISISTSKKQMVVQILFTDYGAGIEPEHLEKIFDPFFTTKPTGKGTGLGLAICYGIIDVHNGRIEDFSEGSGKGASFMINLRLVTK